MADGVFIAIIIVEALAILALAGVLIAKNMAHQKIMSKAQEIVQGKLNVEDIQVNGSENMSAVMASAFNSIKSNLMTFVEATKGNVVVLSDAIDTLSKSVEANQQGNEQIADGVSAVAVKASEQLDLVKENLDIIEENGAKMDEIDASMKNIKKVLDDTVSVCEGGLQNLSSYESDMEVVTLDLNNINEILNEFNDEIARIEEVGDFIIGVSEQLRLLAFNASIEAARAGQEGKGFAVVADEMNEMSVKTKEGMGRINEIVKEIIDTSKQVNVSIKTCENRFNESKDTFTIVNKSFKSINQHSNKINDKINDISDKIDVIANNSDLSKEKAANLYDASIAISENTREIAAASQETAAESSQIGANVDALGNMLTGIQNLLKQFSTAVVPIEKDRSKKVKIAVMSMLDNDFWYGVRRGIYYAQKELSDRNAEVDYMICGGVEDLDSQVRGYVENCIADNFDAIVLPGFLGGANDQLKEAISKGIKVVTYNCDCAPEIKRVACFSPDSECAGIMAAKATERFLNKSGRVGIIYGDLTVGVYAERKETFENYFAGNKNIKIVKCVESLESPEDTYNKAIDMIKTTPDLDVIYLVTGFPLDVARAIVDTGSIGRVSLVSFDHSKEVYDYIKKGVIAAAIGQDPFGQGHDPIISIYNSIVTNSPFATDHIACRLSVVDKSNVNTLVDA